MDAENVTYVPLPKDIKEKWMAALRSGDFLQAQSYLKILAKGKKKVRHCCLGVAADIFPTEGKCDWEKYVPREDPDYCDSSQAEQAVWQMNGDQGNLASAFMDSIGLDQLACDRLMSLNDSGRSFKYIANWIEANL